VIDRLDVDVGLGVVGIDDDLRLLISELHATGLLQQLLVDLVLL